MSGIVFTTSARESLEVLAEALGRCYGAFEERVAQLAAEQGVPWPDPQPDDPAGPRALADMCRVHAVDLAHSVVAREGAGGPIVGVALLGRRGGRGWLGDFAVAPEHRGRGLGHRLMGAFLEQARAVGVRHVEFDVLTVNTPALRVYEAAGFRRDQRMDRFVGSTRDLDLGQGTAAGMRVEPMSREGIAVWFTETVAGQPLPCWERDLPSLLAYDGLQAYVASEGEREMAALACLYEPKPSGRGRPGLRIMFAGFRPEATALHLRALLAHSARDAPAGVDITAGLEPIDSRLAALLRELGFRPTRPAYNMRREL